MAKVLVVGGAGYVGSAASAWLMDRGHEVWILDDLSTGHREFVLSQAFTECRAGERSAVSSLLKTQKFDCAMHFAARSLVAESVAKPDEYYENNVVQTRALLETLLDAGVKKFIFSSTCAIFGDPGNRQISENLDKKPLNPYGETKLQAEQLMMELSSSRGLQAIALRYFNAAGAEPKFRVGEWHRTETHLIPNTLKAAVMGKAVQIFGKDYPTRDGTCVRDYIHVTDLSAAHGAAMERLLDKPGREGGSFEAFNLGSENGYSVLEVVKACETVIGKKIEMQIQGRRPGDPPQLVADSTLARKTLNFKITQDITSIIQSAWEWEQKLHTLIKQSS